MGSRKRVMASVADAAGVELVRFRNNLQAAPSAIVPSTSLRNRHGAKLCRCEGSSATAGAVHVAIGPVDSVLRETRRIPVGAGDGRRGYGRLVFIHVACLCIVDHREPGEPRLLARVEALGAITDLPDD